MKSRLSIVALLLPLFLSSCATRLACDFSAPRLHGKHARIPKGASEEDRVASRILGRTEDGFTVSDVDRIRHMPQCGMDLFATFLTLGLVPHSAPNPVHATVTGYVKGRRTTETFALSLERRTSLWHRLLPESCDERAIARAILQAVRDRKKEEPEIRRMLRREEKAYREMETAEGRTDDRG